VGKVWQAAAQTTIQAVGHEAVPSPTDFLLFRSYIKFYNKK
jgi:hypothetical protein